jgi:ribosomal protein S18 acetylase RimI-like enzyme
MCAESRFRLRPLTAEDGPAVARLFEASADYFEVVLGRPPRSGDAQALYTDGPEDGRPPDGKMLFGIRLPDDEALVGVLDVFAHYPEPGAWYIGLVLLDPTARTRGLGRAVVESFARDARSHGATELQINVVEQNSAALSFWTRLGFTEMRRWRQHYGERESTFIRMRRQLEPMPGQIE